MLSLLCVYGGMNVCDGVCMLLGAVRSGAVLVNTIIQLERQQNFMPKLKQKKKKKKRKIRFQRGTPVFNYGNQILFSVQLSSLFYVTAFSLSPIHSFFFNRPAHVHGLSFCNITHFYQCK